ncbi:hypothetical protein CLV29_0105 [Naumannella halotolerans]|uniref:Uncharacterized protein n=1 Tax=Naumannella halotolerans TaxID=993414 RepID=A0A4R7J719_9ACTN|nr:hypothetical protein CLV29_0105 [Naumannella halotolerans]
MLTGVITVDGARVCGGRGERDCWEGDTGRRVLRRGWSFGVFVDGPGSSGRVCDRESPTASPPEDESSVAGSGPLALLRPPHLRCGRRFPVQRCRSTVGGVDPRFAVRGSIPAVGGGDLRFAVGGSDSHCWRGRSPVRCWRVRYPRWRGRFPVPIRDPRSGCGIGDGPGVACAVQVPGEQGARVFPCCPSGPRPAERGTVSSVLAPRVIPQPFVEAQLGFGVGPTRPSGKLGHDGRASVEDGPRHALHALAQDDRVVVDVADLGDPDLRKCGRPGIEIARWVQRRLVQQTVRCP